MTLVMTTHKTPPMSGGVMSRNATEYLSGHLPEVRQAYRDRTGKDLGENGLALLIYLADATDKKTGVVFQTVETMREGSGVGSTRQVYKLLALFIEAGFLTRTGEVNEYLGRGRATPIYAFTLVPGLWKGAPQDTNTDRLGADLVNYPLSPVTGEKPTKLNNDGVSGDLGVLEPEPEPEPNPHAGDTPAGTAPDQGQGNGKGAQEWGTFHEQVLAFALALEPRDHDRGNLVTYLGKVYRPIVCELVTRYPEGDPDYLGEKAYQMRQAQKGAHTPAGTAQTPPVVRQAPTPNPGEHADRNCPGCAGYGYYGDNKADTQSWCQCAGGTQWVEPNPEAVAKARQKLSQWARKQTA